MRMSMMIFGVMVILLIFFHTLATPTEVISHYYCLLLETLDGSVISRLMLEIKLLTEDDLVHCAKLCSDHQKNAFLMDHLLAMGTASIVEFCHLLQNTENVREIGIMLVNGKLRVVLAV